MDDSLKVLDLTTEGNVSLPADTPVVPTPPTPPTPPTAPLGASAPDPVVVTSTNGPKEKKPMGKKTKIVAGVLSAILLFAGLGMGLFLAKNRQNIAPKAGDAGCRSYIDAQGNEGILCEDGKGGFDFKAQDVPDGARFETNHDTGVTTVYTPQEFVQQQNDKGNTSIGTDYANVGGKVTNVDTGTTTTANTSTGGTSGSNGGTSVGSSTGLTVVGNKVLSTDRNPNTPLTSLCEIKTCNTRAEWEAAESAMKYCTNDCSKLIEAALREANKLDSSYTASTNMTTYLNSHPNLISPIRTDAVRDLDGNASNGIQAADMKREVASDGTVTYVLTTVYNTTLNNDASCTKNGIVDLACKTKGVTQVPAGTVSVENGQLKINFTAGQNISLGADLTSILQSLPQTAVKPCPAAGQSASAGVCVSPDQKTCYDANAGLAFLQSKGAIGTETGCNAQNLRFFTKSGAVNWGTKVGNVWCNSNDASAANDCPKPDANGIITVTINGKTVKFDTINKRFIDTGGLTVGLWECKASSASDAVSQWEKGLGCNTGGGLSSATYIGTNTSLGAITGGCGLRQIDIDSGGEHFSFEYLDLSGCTTTTFTPNTPTASNPPSGGSNPPGGGSNPTPTPTTTNPSYACYQLQIFRGTTQIQPWQINVGDALIFRGFATATNTTVSKMRFVVSINGVAQAPVDVNASLISGQYQADLPYTITQAASYSVTTSPISP